jgi:hypothetical protein
VCRSDENKLATDVDIARGEYSEKVFYVLKPESSNWTDDIWSWIDSQSDPAYKVPKEYCSADTDLVIGFEKPGNESRINSNSFEVRIKVTTAKDIEWVRLYSNGSEIESFGAEKMISTNITLPDGTYELMAKVRTKDGSEKDTKLKIGVNMDWNASPSPSVSPTPTPTP